MSKTHRSTVMWLHSALDTNVIKRSVGDIARPIGEWEYCNPLHSVYSTFENMCGFWYEPNRALTIGDPVSGEGDEDYRGAVLALAESMRPSAQSTMAALERLGYVIRRRT